MYMVILGLAKSDRAQGLLALSPLVVFLAVFLVSSVVARDFYKVPVVAAFLVASAYAIAITGKAGTLNERIGVFSRGAGDHNVLMMIWIFVLAGAFASTAKEIGAIDATVNLTLMVLPERLMYASFFLASCFISMAIGTSVGTIVALVPIATGVAAQTGTGVPFMTAIIVGGAFFGDNLSFISDTTIAATRTLGCRMDEKFKANIAIAAPAALVVAAIYVFKGMAVNAVPAGGAVDILAVSPYLAVILLALSGANVIAVLGAGIVFNGVIGFIRGNFDWVGWLSSIGGGVSSLGDLIIVTLLAGGMLELIRYNGGLDYIIDALSKRISGRRGAEFSIAGIVSLVNLCTANNTIAIITSGPLAKNLSERYGISPRRAASILDTFSCMVQGLIPYGAQLLMASGLAGVSVLSITANLYYPFALGFFAVLTILCKN